MSRLIAGRPNLWFTSASIMGIYDRDYYREPEPGFTLRAPRSMVVTLMLINGAFWLLNALFWPDNWLTWKVLAATDQTIRNPLLWWKFLTYGFAHSPQPMHILFNMLQLFFLGRIVEQLYGRWEFLRIYLVMIVLGGFFWGARVAFFDPGPALVVGASGAVVGVIMLFILKFPHQTLTLFPIPIPIKAWVLGVILVGMNVYGALDPKATGTAFDVHLVGVAFAYLYVQGGWNLGRLVPSKFAWPKLRRGPKLRIHDPSGEQAKMSAEVDKILAKVHREGENSLTRKERRILEKASREYRKRNDGP